MTIETVDLKSRIASRVHATKDELLSGRHADRLRELLEVRGVLVIRGLEFGDDDLLTFTRTFGDVFARDSGEVYKVSINQGINPRHYLYNYGNFSWHIDRTDTDVPPFATILNARQLSAEGGNTEFANTYAAYADLPDEDKTLIEDLRVVHRVESSFRETLPDMTEEQRAMFREHPDKVHPLVWRHRSGRKSLITSTSGAEIVGLEKDEGDALLRRMMEWTSQPRYVYRHEWEIGDIVMWDNTGVMHRVERYDANSGRVLHRTTIAGDEPFSEGRKLAMDAA